MNADDVRITVARKLFHQDLVGEYTEGPEWMSCEVLQDGGVFVSERGGSMPPGFCSWAWADIQKYVMALARGASFVGVRPGFFVTCQIRIHPHSYAALVVAQAKKAQTKRHQKGHEEHEGKDISRRVDRVRTDGRHDR